jgi:carbonic anhydrase/acetyltransferase-like protein (isoleucine patch superfamily)
MNTHPAGNPSHPEHLDYFTKIVAKHLALSPSVPADAFVAPGAFLSGAVTLGFLSNIWPGASLRADIAPIVIGDESNVQDNAVIHVATGLGATIGRRVTVGHSAVIHACTIGNNCLIGMGAVILDGAVIGENCLIGARTLVLVGTEIPPGSMVVGSPGKIVRTLSPEEQTGLGAWVDHYLILSKEYRARGIIHPDYQD